MKYSLCSLSRLINDDWKMKGEAKGIGMINKGNKLVFEIVVQTCCLYINKLSNKLVCSSIAHKKQCSINDAHE